MSSLEFHLSYSREEDRIHVFARDPEGTEHAFALTRTLFKKLWPALGQAMRAMSDAARKAAAPVKEEILRFEQEAAVAKAVQSGSLSRKPVPKAEKRLVYLAKTVQLRESTKGQKVLSLTDGTHAINIPMSREGLLSFCAALRAVVENSDWDLRLADPWAEPAPQGPFEPSVAPTGGKPPTRH